MPATLGLIVPDDQDDGPLDYELYRLGPWLERAGVDVMVETEDSPTPGVEVVADSERLEHCLLKTGSDEALHPCARKLAERGCQALVWACTSGSFIGGHRWAQEQANRLRGVSNLPTTSTTLAIVEALSALDCRQIDLLSTYPAFMTGRLIRTLAEAGIEVVQTISLECDPNNGFGLYANFVIQLDLMDALASFDGISTSSRPIVVPNTSMNTLELVGEMERVTGRTVVTANQASLWHGLRMVGCLDTPREGGSLFELTSPRSVGS